MCYFCRASRIEWTNNLFQLKQAAAPVTGEVALLHRITSSFGIKKRDRLDGGLEGRRAPYGTAREASAAGWGGPGREARPLIPV